LALRNKRPVIFQILNYLKPKKTGSVTKSGKANAGMECPELSFEPAWITLPC
jgi:hypothetical protein